MNISRKASFLWILIFLSMILVNRALAEPAAALGYIEELKVPKNFKREDFKDLKNVFIVKRNSRKKSIRLFDLIYENDEIIISKDHYQIILSIREHTETIGYKQSPYLVKRKAPPLDQAGIVIGWITNLFDQWHEDELRRRYLHIRGESDISIPLLEEGGVLAPESDKFYLGWKGGKEPYRIKIYRQFGNEPIVAQDSIRDTRVAIENVTFLQGTYTLKIQDAEKSKATENFTVVAPNRLPPRPAELRGSRLSKSVDSTLYATWLASQNNGKWLLQSYQFVAGISDDYYPALLLRNALEDGEQPVLKTTP